MDLLGELNNELSRLDRLDNDKASGQSWRLGFRRVALCRSTNGRPLGSRPAENPRPPGVNGD